MTNIEILRNRVRAGSSQMLSSHELRSLLAELEAGEKLREACENALEHVRELREEFNANSKSICN